MPSASGFGGVAGGDIYPRRFLKAGATAGFVLQATAGDQVLGASGPGTRTVNYAGLADTKHAVAGESVRVLTPGEICDLEAGAAFAIGARLKSDANGKAIAVSANNDQYGAVALAPAGAAGQFIPCRIEVGVHGQ